MHASLYPRWLCVFECKPIIKKSNTDDFDDFTLLTCKDSACVAFSFLSFFLSFFLPVAVSFPIHDGDV